MKVRRPVKSYRPTHYCITSWCGPTNKEAQTYPKIPAAKYVIKKPAEPISRSIWTSIRLNNRSKKTTNLSGYSQLGEHVEDDMDETRVQEDRSDESETENLQSWSTATSAHLPEPLIGLTTMEATETAHLLYGTEPIWWICGIIEA